MIEDSPSSRLCAALPRKESVKVERRGRPALLALDQRRPEGLQLDFVLFEQAQARA